MKILMMCMYAVLLHSHIISDIVEGEPTIIFASPEAAIQQKWRRLFKDHPVHMPLGV